MGKVLLLTTGQLERRGLPASLGRLFPGHEFESTERPLPSFTSSRLVGTEVTREAHSNVRRLAATLVAAVAPGSRRKGRYDLVCATDDLELANVDQPERIVTAFRQAVESHVREHRWPAERSRERALDALRRRCSFHLFVPMTEAYFFADRSAIVRAGARRSPQLAPGRDLEDFLTVDSKYLSDPGDEYGGRHPKRYLDWLCRPGEYETRNGVAALGELDWRSVVADPDQVRFARSFLLDVADAIGEPPPVSGSPHPLTSRTGTDSVLRNV